MITIEQLIALLAVPDLDADEIDDKEKMRRSVESNAVAIGLYGLRAERNAAISLSHQQHPRSTPPTDEERV